MKWPKYNKNQKPNNQTCNNMSFLSHNNLPLKKHFRKNKLYFFECIILIFIPASNNPYCTQNSECILKINQKC